MLTSVGVVIGLIVITSDTLDVRQHLYVRTTTATGLTQDTRVFLQGLQVGRVSQVNPNVTESGLNFVAELSLQQTFPDGTPLQLPRGTVAIITEPSPIAASVIRLEMPSAATDVLAPGDTLESRRLASAVDLLGEVATELKEEVLAMIQQTRMLMERSRRTMATTDAFLSATGSTLDSTRPRIDSALALLTTSLERTNDVLAEVTPRVGPLQDSLTTTLARANLVLSRVDTIAASAQTILTDDQALIHDALAQLASAAAALDHFVREVSRRPTRLLTGVEPPARDTSESR